MNKIKKVWNFKKCDLKLARELAYELDLPLPIIQVMLNRNVTSLEEAKQFLDLDIKKLHNPFLLPDSKAAIERISKAIDAQEKIFVWGDYDVDGITSTAIVVTALNKMGANLEYKVPHRIEDGYDIKLHSVDEAIDRKAQLLISVDCGILAFETAEYASRCGIDLIITDHHHPSDDGKIPDCIAVVNPNRHDSKYPNLDANFKRYPFDSLAGCGIAFKLMLGLAKHRKLNVMEFVDDLIEFAALGTVADVAPMIDENRVIVSYGCRRLAISTKPGVKELLRIANVKDVNTTSIGFQIGPRINAIGRLADSGTALNLLLAKNDFVASNLATQLDSANRKRQDQQENAVRKAIEIVNDTYDLENEHIIVIGNENWHPGLIGLIAGKLAEHFNKPSLVCSYKNDGYAKGSCRSVRDFNILNALKSENVIDLFKKKNDGSPVVGGHAFAAGFELPISNMSEMRVKLNEYAKNIFGEPIKEKIIDIDAKFNFHDLTLNNFKKLQLLSPFGSGNENPKFITKNIEIAEIKQLSGGKHLKLKLTNGDKQFINAVGWQKGDYFDLISCNDNIDIVYSIDYDSYSNNNNIVLIFDDLVVNK